MFSEQSNFQRKRVLQIIPFPSVVSTNNLKYSLQALQLHLLVTKCTNLIQSNLIPAKIRLQQPCLLKTNYSDHSSARNVGLLDFLT